MENNIFNELLETKEPVNEISSYLMSKERVVKESFCSEAEEVSDALESVLVIALEAKLSTAERNKLPDKMFGLPKQRKFPLDQKTRIFEAIKFFKYCKGEDRKELANNIVKRMKELDMPITFDEKSLISKYITQ